MRTIIVLRASLTVRNSIFLSSYFSLPTPLPPDFSAKMRKCHVRCCLVSCVTNEAVIQTFASD